MPASNASYNFLSIAKNTLPENSFSRVPLYDNQAPLPCVSLHLSPSYGKEKINLPFIERALGQPYLEKTYHIRLNALSIINRKKFMVLTDVINNVPGDIFNSQSKNSQSAQYIDFTWNKRLSY